jgi:hypothetical protein
MEQPASSDRKLKIVLGYLPVDELPAKARDLRLFCRVTFILESYRAQAVDAFFDAELYAALVDVVRRIVRPDRIVTRLPSGNFVEMASTGDFENELRHRAQEAEAPLEDITLFRESIAVAFVTSEPYVNAGGPPPYNDSYAVPVFSSEDISDDVMREVKLVCARSDAVIEEVIAGKRTIPRGRARDRLLGTLRKLVGW